MKLIDKYLLRFDDFPPLYTTLSFEDEIYQELMQIALDRGEPITSDEIDEYIEKHNIEFDVIY